jgi:secreted PhoX family phosphatase
MKAVIPNPRFAAEAKKSPEIRKGLRDVAEDVKRFAEAAAISIGAPWMARSGHELIEVGEDDEGVYVANTDHGGHLQEYGSRNNPPHAPLRQGAQSAGLRVDER